MTPDDARRRFAAMPAAAEAAIGAALDRVAETAAAAARRSLGTGAGPGTPPADPHGNLADAIVTGRDGDAATLSCTAPFAADLEYGTTRTPARPFLRPAIAATADDARQVVIAALQAVPVRGTP